MTAEASTDVSAAEVEPDGFAEDGENGSGARVRVDDEAWRDLLITQERKTGCVVLPNVSNVVTFLRYHREWRGVFAWDAFGERVITQRPAPWHPAVAPACVEVGVFRETDIARTVDWLARSEGIAVGQKTVEEAIPVVAEAHSFHPVREYLEGLTWDGVERLPTMLATYCGGQQSDYSAAVGTRWMISACARPFDPGCQVDCMLVLEGPQGAGKSSAFRALVPSRSLYSETGVSIGEKDSYQALHGIWIYLLDELDSLKRGDISKTKNFMTAVKDHYRPSYGRVARDFFRQNVFAGTTNESEYLVDRTGNRRFWPVRVVRGINVAALVRDRDQLWAEAFSRYANGERWHVDTSELRALCEAEQADRVQADPWEEIAGRWLARPRRRVEGDRGVATGLPFSLAHGVTTAEILEHAIGKPEERINRADEMRVAEVLRALGYKRGPRRMENGTRVRRYQVVQVVQEGSPVSNTEKEALEAPHGPPTQPESTHTQGTFADLDLNLQNTDPGGPGGPGGAGSFSDDMADLGVGGDE